MLKDFRPLFQNKPFVYLWISQIFSQLTIHIMNFLLIVVLFNKTGSAIATSFLWVAYALPALLVGPVAAAYVDMTSRKKILLITNLFQSIVIFAYALIASSSLFLLYSFAVTYSFINQFYIPAEFASLPSLVSKKNFPLANGLFFMTQHGAIIAGFTIAGVLNRLLGFEKSLLLCSLFLFIAYLSIYQLPKMKSKKKISLGVDDLVFAFFLKIKDGYVFLKSKPVVYVPFLSLMFLQIIVTTVVINAPLLATDIFHTSVDWMGVLLAVPASLGAIVGAVIVSRLLKKRVRKSSIIQFSFAIVTVSFGYVSFIASFLPASIRDIIALIAIFIVGIGFVGSFIPLQTQLQEVTPGGMRGRVFGNFWFLVTIATVFPVLFSGAVSDLLGIRVFYALIAIIMGSGYVFMRRYGKSIIKNNFKK